MDPASGAYQPGEPPRPPTAAEPPLVTWPATVQLTLCLILTASTFFLIGRWTQAPAPAPAIVERGNPVLDLNRATRAELRLLPGLGDALAERVIEYRTRHGRFGSVEDLRAVAGIGPKTLDRLRPWLFVSREEFLTAEESTEPPMPPPMRPATSSSKKLMELTGPIDVNTASQADLQKLPGIGPKLSQRILDTREKGLFKSVDELRRVPGIGPKTLEKIRPYVVTGDQ